MWLQVVAEPKIATLAKAGITEPLDGTLKYCFILVGLRAQNFPAAEEITVLTNYIEKYYGGHTPGEIRLAFEMALQGKFVTKDGKPVDYHPYENFSVEYFATIMNAYREWAAPVANQLLPPPEITPPPRWSVELEFLMYVYRLNDRYLKPPLTNNTFIKTSIICRSEKENRHSSETMTGDVK